MAVNINIPTIGTVTASNAAEESTLRAILTAVQQQNRVIRGNESTIESIQTSQTRNAQTANANLARVAAGASQSASSISSLSREVSGSFADTQAQVRSLGGYLKSLGASALNASLSIAKHSKSINQSPIEQSIRNVNTLIDGAGAAMGGIIGLFGSGKLKGAQATLKSDKKFSWKEVFGGLGEGANQALKYVNEMLGSQLQTTVDSFDQFNKMGANFSLGMMEMRAYTGRAGVLLDVFTRGIQSAEQAVRSLGLSFSLSSGAVAKVMEDLRETTDAEGTRLQEVLRRLGYSQEEQIALSADYLALLKTTMSTEEFRDFEKNRIDSEVARRTVEYGKNLKLLSDLTGASAQEIAREQRQRRLSALAVSTMTEKEADTYSQVGSALSKMGVAGEALERMILQTSQFGGVVDPDLAVMMQAFPELQGRIQDIVNIQKNEGLTAEESSAMIMGIVGDIGQYVKENARGNDALAALAQANLAGVGNFRTDFIEDLSTIGFDSATITTITKNQDNAARGFDDLTKSVIASEMAIRDITVEIEKLATTALPTYAGFLESVNSKIRTFFEVITGGIEAIGSMPSLSDFMSSDEKTNNTKTTGGGYSQGEVNAPGSPESVSQHDISAKAELQRAMQVARMENAKEKFDYDKLALALKDVMPEFDFSGLENAVNNARTSQETKSDEIKQVLDLSTDVLRQIAKSSDSSVEYASRNYSWNT